MPAAAKGPKRRRGCPAVASRLQRSHPRTPVYGGYPYILPQKFRRAKYGSGVLFLPGHRTLIRCKISACSVSPPRLVPTSRGRGCRVGDASIGTAPKTGNGRASVPPLRYEKKVLLQRNDGRGKPLPCGMGGETLCGKGLRPLLLSERKNGGPSGPPFAAPLIPRRSYSNKQAVSRASRSPLRWGRRL